MYTSDDPRSTLVATTAAPPADVAAAPEYHDFSLSLIHI